MLKEREKPKPPVEDEVEPETRSKSKPVVASYPNHVWQVDLTVVPTIPGLWAAWIPFALPQVWPLCRARHKCVFFLGEMRKRLVEKSGWAIVKEGDAWLGVRPLGDQGFDLKPLQEKKVSEKSRQNTDGFWLWPKADKPPVALVVSRVSVDKTLDDFAAYLASHKHAVVNGVAIYTFVDDLGVEVRMELGGKLPIPQLNGEAVNLYPGKGFDSPYLNSLHGSGVVTIEKGERKLTLDFNQK